MPPRSAGNTAEKTQRESKHKNSNDDGDFESGFSYCRDSSEQVGEKAEKQARERRSQPANMERNGHSKHRRPEGASSVEIEKIELGPRSDEPHNNDTGSTIFSPSYRFELWQML